MHARVYFLFLKTIVKTKQNKMHTSVIPVTVNWKAMMPWFMSVVAVTGVPSGGKPSSM